MAFDGFEAQNSRAEEAEIAVLGAVILDNNLLVQTKSLGVMDFSTPFRRAVFAAILELEENNARIDPILIGEMVRRENLDFQVSSITNLTYGLPHFSDIREYVELIRKSSAQVKAIRTVELLASQLGGGKITLKNFCNGLSALENELRETRAEETDSFKPLSEVLQTEVLPTLDAYFKNHEAEFLISTGFPEIDDILGGGLYLSDFLAIVAPPKSAKSAFALQLALKISERETVGLLSLEMSNLQNGLRFIAQKSFADSIEKYGDDKDAISASYLRPGIYESTYKQASETIATLFDSKLFLCQKPLEWREVQAETRRLVKEKGLRVLIVDYWQLVRNEKPRASRADALAEIAKGLKQLGQELGIVIIALGQFNQEGLKLHKASGELSPLYLEGSGELVKSANIVLTLDIKEGDLMDKHAPRMGTMTFKPLRSAADGRLDCLFFGKYLTVEIVEKNM